MDYLVVGAGPAGLQLGQLLEAAGREYLIVEAGSAPGTFFRTFPRHRKLISINKPHTGWQDPELNLRMDWNSLLSDDPTTRFTRYTESYFPAADDMVRYLADFAEAHRLKIAFDSRITRIERGPDGFFATSESGRRFEAKRLVIATGVSRPHLPPIPGIELADPYTTVSVDPRDFTDQRVLIIGKGNSGFETAENLMETAAVIHVAGPRSIRMAWQSHFVGHLRAVNNNFLDSYQLKSQNALLDGEVKRIERDAEGYLVTFSFVRANEVVKQLRYDRVIACTGFRFDSSTFAPACRPALVINDRFPAQSSEYESTNVPDLYFAGTLSQVRDFKRSTGGFIHGFRYGVRALHRILEHKYHDVSWAGVDVALEPQALCDAVIARVNRTSALWQQFGVLADVIAVGTDGSARYLEELPLDYVHGSEHVPADYFAITLEYGPDHDKIDPFDVTVNRIAQDSPDTAHDAAYLHPVVRHFAEGALVAEHHVAENLENEWDRPAAHREPLTRFFDRQLSLSGNAHAVRT